MSTPGSQATEQARGATGRSRHIRDRLSQKQRQPSARYCFQKPAAAISITDTEYVLGFEGNIATTHMPGSKVVGLQLRF